MNWWQALILGLVQGLTEFLPVSSSGHLMLVREVLGVDAEGFLDFTLAVHFATVLSTLVFFWKVIYELLKGVCRFRYNDETDYALKIIVSMVPVGVVGLLFKDQVEALFADSLTTVAVALLVTAILLVLSDFLSSRSERAFTDRYRNGISFWQAAVVGLAQAVAVAPGLSRSGTTIAAGLLSGVRRDRMAQFSFLMVIAPILGEQLLEIIHMLKDPVQGASVGAFALICGAVAAFSSGLFAVKVMIELVKRARLWWFAAYCLLVALCIFIFA